jgi:hypothetical protein
MRRSQLRWERKPTHLWVSFDVGKQLSVIAHSLGAVPQPVESARREGEGEGEGEGERELDEEKIPYAGQALSSAK